MWKKDEARSAEPAPQQPTRATVSKTTASGPAKATIGPSIHVQGDVSGNEDLLIQGRVDGSVSLELHSVAVGSEGRVNANITGRVITIEGRVEGDLTAKEQIVLLGTANVQGDLKAPRLVLEDGATFRGLVEMGTGEEETPVEESPRKAPAAASGSKAKGSGTGTATATVKATAGAGATAARL